MGVDSQVRQCDVQRLEHYRRGPRERGAPNSHTEVRAGLSSDNRITYTVGVVDVKGCSCQHAWNMMTGPKGEDPAALACSSLDG